MKTAEDRLRNALSCVGWVALDDELIKKASSSFDVDKKIEALTDYRTEKEIAREKAHEELGADYLCSWDWYVMPKEEVIKILNN